ncbi:E3 ubiquitin-protein ligase rnf213-alpha (Mysterin-A) (Mysterin-alpha) (RING finger protein 213-A) (RING finger protein 213-alpha) (RING-type E3 ubiquitin transferase rnf213-alpha) [Durusdinium trenchii]|uniref:E3 ubiquitin-protein ligase rnf213-alpha (Mysterin-A) (Mysterin-alpha) (RING finger protein 213-A) (RING finger protein 213-alpha) (RING-type E3 ubiquitin transferase rnf213-alpha) n=1 Tax=Durusdinium trenchii TaxID=1381693 RepID=A0ABP0RAJ9_9DINO
MAFLQVDNLIKLMSIQQRLKYGLPVILMGETGCGKTALVKFLAETLDFKLCTLDIHGGITDASIIAFLEDAIQQADHERGAGATEKRPTRERKRVREVLVFFDEINAANCMALFKTIIIDRMYGNKYIPENVRIISCCNPYRKRRNKELEDVALVYNAAAGDAATGISDPMKELVYRVHPLPESLIDVVSDFGSLSEASEVRRGPRSAVVDAGFALLLPGLALFRTIHLGTADLDRFTVNEIYIKAILKKDQHRSTAQPELPRKDGAPAEQAAPAESSDEYEVFINAFCELLCQSQNYVREAESMGTEMEASTVNEGERSVVSMRDIGRAARVFKWFLTSYSRLHGESASAAVRDDKDGTLKIDVCIKLREHLRRALVLTMGYCYHSRLNRNQRWGYRKRLCETWERLRSKDDDAMVWLQLADANELNKMLIDTSYEFVWPGRGVLKRSQMDLGEGIALNEALRENLFMLLVSVMNQIPILLIGKPGCSKSLAMGVLQNNLNGEVSSRDFFKSMPAVDVFAYQCSPLSTPDAILNAFHSARQSNLGHKSTIVCVLLDEVGLAEESPHLPLKVLHKELEDLRGIACVGISNWALDAAKMSRCVTLYRPPPTVEDLSVTAEGMVQSANLKAYLRALSEAFAEIYKRQKRADFWGMREFYSTVRVINAELKIRAAEGLEAVLEPKVLMKTVQRNFGGQPEDELEACIEEFFERTGMDFMDVTRLTTPELIQQNLGEPDARHLMLLTKNNAALRLLFEGGLLDHSRAEVMFGSTFPNDLSDMFVAMNLQRIKSFMQQPISLVMVHCDSLYETLCFAVRGGEGVQVRIAHGSKAKQCPIHKLFRVIVVTELSDAYFRLAPPLLNRFEKQIFLRKDLMTKSDEALLARVGKFWQTLNELMNAGKSVKDDDALEEATQRPGTMLNTASHRPIAGYHPELLSSLVFTLRKSHTTKSLDELVEIAKRAVTWVLTPVPRRPPPSSRGVTRLTGEGKSTRGDVGLREAVCITAATLQPKEMQMKFGFDIVSEYFEQQRHSDLPSFAEMTVQNKDDRWWRPGLGHEFWCDEYGGQTMVMTYSPIRGKVGAELGKVEGLVARAEVSLHELSSSTDIEKAVHDFYNLTDASGAKNFLIIHADPVAASVRMIEHCRFVCEKVQKGCRLTLPSICTFPTEESRNFLRSPQPAGPPRHVRAARRAWKARNSFCQKGKGVEGSMFVVLVVHLQRGTRFRAEASDRAWEGVWGRRRDLKPRELFDQRYDGKFSFDFDSQWSAVFLDSVEPSADLSSMPSLGAMLNMPLIDVVEGLEFPKLLRSCFRSSLSRLMYLGVAAGELTHRGQRGRSHGLGNEFSFGWLPMDRGGIWEIGPKKMIR